MARDLSQRVREVRLEIAEEDADRRLDHLLVERIFWRSRTDLQSRIRRGRVFLNDRVPKPSARLRRGDVVRVIVDPSDLPDQDPAEIPLRILHEDEHLVVLDKQAGLVVHPTGRHVYDTLMNALHLRCRENGEAARGVEPHVVHRLDRNTSGVLVVAKNFEAKRALALQFEAREPRKTYLALVEGLPERDEGRIDAPIGPDEHAEIRLKMTTRPEGLPSRTDWEVVERFATHALLRARPHTGRQHQIRVHLAAIGHPIVCDPLYGDPRSVGPADEPEPLLERQALHAEELRFSHPADGAEMSLRAELAADIRACVEALRRGRALAPGRDLQSERWR